ncbi:aspartate-semialdehyde dehydrogenase [Balneatrix alpica]|uniref:Aspartate-semialdehyde dehydrogenase n=1 Tax=Balneatrix alpica TaxID=75684 RepID=A0ABV5ZA15_9GAMM|nr:aspartate-semialdehyde dehydrogenase [Balneatrix alpica]
MSKTYNVAVVGATGAVGETLIEILEQRQFPVKQLFLLASERSAGKVIYFQERSVKIQLLDNFDFSQVDIAFFMASGELAKAYAPKAAAAGAVVIDNSSAFRYEQDVPLVVAEVNPEAVAGYRARNLIANPNCSTIQMLVALKPIHDEAGVERINVATYQAVSGSGREAVEELAKQTIHMMSGKGREDAECEVYPKSIAFNVLPQIDVFEDNGYTREEMKMVRETRKILGDEHILVNPTCVRVPVFFGHSEAVHLETREPISVERVQQLLAKAPGVKLLDERKAGGYPTPAGEAAGNDWVWVGRVRKDISWENGLNLWVVADNVRKGAATNSVQIAEILVRDYLNQQN